MKTIVLAEKLSVAWEIARVLGCHRRQNGYIEGSEYIVTWAMGHLIELAEPAVYNPAYKRWTMSSLPMLPGTMKHQVIPRTKDQFAVICELCKRRDVTIRRLWISSQTDSAISQGFKDLKPKSAYGHLIRAAETRSEADWIVGRSALHRDANVRLSFLAKKTLDVLRQLY